MATKTERILSRLPGTFRALPPPTALHALAQAFGGELQRAENALAEVMQSHWVGHADRGADGVRDLARMAALYGLAPRRPPLPEETVEEFRARLTSHVRTFLEGTSTLSGVMQVAADALGLRIEPQLDGWWNRRGGDPVLTRPRGDDAAADLFGVPAAVARGRAATPAAVRGPVLSAEGADLRGGATLRLSLDGGEPRDVACAVGADDLSRVPLSAVAAAIDQAFGGDVARDQDGALVLRSPSVGGAATVEVHEVPGDDAAPVLLGLPARRYVGRAGADARIAGRVELPAAMDLREHRYLRITVDGARLAEVDCCAGADPAATTPGQARDAINAVLGPIASIVAGRLVLTSTTPGAGGSLVVREAAAQDAAARLLGDAPRAAQGRDPAPAEAVGAVPLPAEMDLGTRFAVRISIDGRRPVTVDCAGVDPRATGPLEVAARLAAALAPGTAWFDGLFLHAASGSTGPESTLEILAVAPEEDAGPLLFGLRPRVFRGEDAAPAVIHGTPGLSAGVDTRARGRLGIAVDGAPPVEVVLPAPTLDKDGNVVPVPVGEISRAIDRAVGQWIASVEGDRLVLASNTRGTAASVEIVPLEEREQRPFVTRAFVTGEAASVLLGVPTASAAGAGAEKARIAGTVDLRRGVDLRPARWLRLSVDGAPAVDVDCAAHAARPRVALPDDVARAINAAFPPEDGSPEVASVQAGRLVLTSRRAGAAALLRLEPPRALDARPLLLGREPGLWRGTDGRRVVFAGTADLGGGVDLSTARHLRLRVDGAEHEADCAGTDPAATALPEIVAAINTTFARQVARTDGAHLVISSAGPEGHVEVLPARDGPDAAPALLGIAPPRAYHGQPPGPAVVEGTTLLAGPLDLSVSRFLRLAVDGAAPVDVDCAARAADHPAAVSPADVADAIQDVLGPGTAEVTGGRLVLRTRSMGSGARIELLPFTRDDAREALFGGAPDEARGRAPSGAEIVGTVDLRGGADLSSGRTLRVRVDGGRARDVDVAGVLVGSTEPDEVVAAINGVLPGLASLTADGQLRLASPSAGSGSALEVLPVRVLEVVEYPAEPVADPPRELRHGGRATVENDGAHESDAVLELHAPRGASGPSLADAAAGLRIRYLRALGAGDTLRVARDPMLGVRATVTPAGGQAVDVPPGDLLAGSAAPQVHVPFDGVLRLARGRPGQPAALRLDDPWQPRVVALRERTPAPPHGLRVQVSEHALGASTPAPAGDGRSVTLYGRVTAEGGRHLLVDGGGGHLAALLPGTAGSPERHVGRVVAAQGDLHPSAGGPPVLVGRRMDRVFDVTVRERAPGTAVETFAAVSIGSGAEHGLARRVVASRSALVMAADEDKGALLRLARGRAEWVYTECHGARHDLAEFNHLPGDDPLATVFPGEGCVEMGLFDVNRLADTPADPGAAVLAAGPGSAPPVSLVVRWTRHRPGAFELRLPAELPDWFGGRLDAARLGKGVPPEAAKDGGPVDPDAGREVYRGVVTEPAGDPHFLVTRLAASSLVTVSVVPRAPIGWRAIPVPFRRPRVLRLSGGRDDRAARIYITDPDVPVVFEVLARGAGGAGAAGAWGNLVEIGVGPQVPEGGTPGMDPPVPGRFQVTVGYAGARVEGARAAAGGGGEAPPPGPVGVLHARAAGVAARVIRERAEFAAPENGPHLRKEPA